MNTYEKEVVNNFVENLTNEIVGKRVVDVYFDKINTEHFNTVVLVLETGTTLKIEGYGECCASGEVDFVNLINLSDNAITSVKIENADELDEGGYNSGFKVFLLSSFKNEEFNSVEIGASVTEGTGYYSYGWYLTVVKD